MSTDSHTSIKLPAVGVYVIDPARSSVSYTGRHMFGLGSVHAAFTINSGEVRVTDPPSASTVTVSIKADSFASGNAKRDRDVRSTGLLDSTTYPEITFTSDDLQRNGDHWLLNGTVTAHGTTVPTE